MPRKAEWSQRLRSITDRIRGAPVELIDRASVEQLFEVRRLLVAVIGVAADSELLAECLQRVDVVVGTGDLERVFRRMRELQLLTLDVRKILDRRRDPDRL